MTKVMDCKCCDLLFSKEGIKKHREARLESCGACGKLAGRNGIVLKLCERCKNAPYCSRECQKSDWKNHKPKCATEDGKGMSHFVDKAISNPLISHYISIALVYLFKLHEATFDERVALSRASLHAEIEMVVEPRDVRQLMSLVEQMEAWNHEGVEGVVQMSKLMKLRTGRRPAPHQLKLEKQHRLELDLFGFRDCPVVVLEFVNHSIPVASQILILSRETLRIAKEKTFPDFKSIVHPINGDTPLSLQAFVNPGFTNGSSTDGDNDDSDRIVNHINEHIRFDEKNEFRLRTPMTKRDKDLIIKSFTDTLGKQYVGDSSPAAYFIKLLREPIYDELRYDVGMSFAHEGFLRSIFKCSCISPQEQ